MFRKAMASLLLASAAPALALAQEAYVDPMRPYQPPRADARSTAAGPRYQLSAVLISPTRRVAVVNGRPCTEGDRIDGAEVLAIERGAVRLRSATREITIHLSSPRLPSSRAEQGASSS